MDHYAGIDVSLKESSVCVVDARGKVVREVNIASEPEALVRYFGELGLPVSRIRLEAGPLSQWLHAGIVAADFEVQWKDALWARFYTEAPERQRRSVERYNIVKRA